MNASSSSSSSSSNSNCSSDSLTSDLTAADAGLSCVPCLVSSNGSQWTLPTCVQSQTTAQFSEHMMPGIGMPLPPFGHSSMNEDAPISGHTRTPESTLKPRLSSSVLSKTSRRASNPKFLSSLMQVAGPVGQECGHVTSPVSISSSSPRNDSLMGDNSTYSAAEGVCNPFGYVPNWRSGLPAGHHGGDTRGYYCSPFGWETRHKMAASSPLLSIDKTRSVLEGPLDLSRPTAKQEVSDDRTVKSSRHDGSDSQQPAQFVRSVSVKDMSCSSLVSSSQRTLSPSYSSNLAVRPRGHSLDLDVKRTHLYAPVAMIPSATPSFLSPQAPVTFGETASLTNAYSTAITKSAFRTVKTSTPPSMPSPVAPPTGTSIRMKEMLVYENRVLQMEFQELVARGGVALRGSSVQQLQKSYQEAVDQTETRRFQALRDGMGETQRELVHSHYDQQRLLLLRDIRQVLHGEIVAHMSASDATAQPLPNTPVSMATVSNPTTQPLSDVNHSCPFELTSPDYFIGKGTKRKYLNQEAVFVLNAWYEQHFDHPYPEDDAVDTLASRAGISTSQVKKWMANKRVRSCNTLAFNGSIHPKKLQKLLQLKDCPLTPPPEPRCEIETPPSEKHGRSKRMLDPSAVSLMNQWYYEHQAYPYPTEDEKRRIACATGVTAAQVTCWFANKRNRSHNTRKMSAAHMLHKLNRKLQMYNTMQRNRLSSTVSCDGMRVDMQPCEMVTGQTLTQVN